MTTYTKIYENLRRFEVEMVFSADGCLASITENGANVWSIYAHTEKSLKAKVTSWIKANW